MRVTKISKYLLESSPVFGRHLQICINLRSYGSAPVSEEIVAASVPYDDRQDEDAKRQKGSSRNDTPRSTAGPGPHSSPKSEAANEAQQARQPYDANVLNLEK